MKTKRAPTPHERIFRAILFLRGQKVIVDADLAYLYGVPTKVLLQAVRRNLERFPADFMYVLSKREAKNLRSQFVTSKRGGRRYRPCVFTEQGVAMLSSVLRSRRAVQINIQIMRAFVRFNRFLSSHKRLARKLEQLEERVGTHDKEIRSIFEMIQQFIEPLVEKPKRQIGFHA